MHDIKWIRDNAEPMKEALRARGWDGIEVEDTVAEIFALDDRRREIIALTQKGQEERNRLSKEIGQAMAKKDANLAEALKARVAQLKDDMEGAAAAERGAIAALERALAELPNIPLSEVPIGRDEHDNVETRVVGSKPSFPEGFAPKEHFEVGEALGMMDFEAAARMSGARFVVLKGGLARLERALGQFMLDLHTGEHGYEEVNPPLLVRDDAVFGTNQLPKFKDDLFSVFQGLEAVEGAQASAAQAEHRWLIPTAEVPLTNLVREQILDEKQLPIRVTALTPCFRAEAGAAGRDTRGMIRQHQFSKVELVSIVHPDKALEEHERMTACAEEVLKRLDLHYRVVTLCTGDMGFGSQKTYDIEVWLPGQDRFREISSCSVCGEFQARRMNARFRPAEGKGNRFVATLNGSGVAVGRALIAVLENYQTADGSITVPSALRPYMGGLERIEARK
jgi:seryl-tRNA synthetase